MNPTPKPTEAVATPESAPVGSQEKELTTAPSRSPESAAPCLHINLIKQVGPMDGGEASTRYRCQGCGESLTAKPYEIVVESGSEPQARSEENQLNQRSGRHES